MVRALRYLWNSARYPQRRDFVDMGLGIEARHERCMRHWEPHLQNCREFQQRCFTQGERIDSLAILGSGRLLDIDTKLLEQRFHSIDCFDADPSAAASVTRWAKRARSHGCAVRFHCEDVTGSMQAWTAALEGAVHRLRSFDVESLAQLIGTLAAVAVPPTRIFSAVLSANILSQLALYWRDRVAAILRDAYGVDSDDDGRYVEPLDSALGCSMRTLQAEHLSLLGAWAAQHAVLVTDTAWLYYDKDSSLWRDEPAIDVELSLDAKWQLSGTDQWFWHIAPQGVEQSEHGTIHDVHALRFVRG